MKKYFFLTTFWRFLLITMILFFFLSPLAFSAPPDKKTHGSSQDKVEKYDDHLLTPYPDACYSDTEVFDPNYGMFWNSFWSHTVSDLPSNFTVDSANIEIRARVWAWGFYPYPARLDILCSDTNDFFVYDPDYFVCSLTPGTHPNPNNFYTITCPLKQNQIDWLMNDKSLNFAVVSNNGTYYLDYNTLTVCGSVDVCECDLNNDGSCNILDWPYFIEDWGRTDCNDPGVDCECDLNGDGSCNILDWPYFIEDWGRTDCPQ